MEKIKKFNPDQVEIINEAAGMAEELVSDFFKISASQWSKRRYDVKTLVELSGNEIVHGPFAQVIRYSGRRGDTSLGSSTYDFYKICVQDHAILAVTEKSGGIKLFPFTLYIITHELVHIIRFSKFLQSFDASPCEIYEEEIRVHDLTNGILKNVRLAGLRKVMRFYHEWRLASQ